jgi:hypothetical protein
MPDVAQFTVACATGNIPKGIYNVCNPGYSSAQEIVSMMGIEKEFFTEEEFEKAIIAPRSNCILNTDKLQSVFHIQDVKTALATAILNDK